MRFQKLKNSLSCFKDPRSMTVGGLLIALYVLTSAIPFLHFYISDSIRLSVSFIFIVIAAYLYGPIMAAIVGGIADVLAWVIHPHGMLIIGISLSIALSGVVFGVFYYKAKPSFWRTLAASVTESVLIELLLKTFCLSHTFHLPFWATFVSRAITAGIMLPIMVALSIPIFKLAAPLKKLTKNKR